MNPTKPLLTKAQAAQLLRAQRDGFLVVQATRKFPTELYAQWSREWGLPQIIVMRHGSFSAIEIDSDADLSDNVRQKLSLAILDRDVWMPSRIPAVNKNYTYVRSVPTAIVEALAAELAAIVARGE